MGRQNNTAAPVPSWMGREQVPLSGSSTYCFHIIEPLIPTYIITYAFINYVSHYQGPFCHSQVLLFTFAFQQLSIIVLQIYALTLLPLTFVIAASDYHTLFRVSSGSKLWRAFWGPNMRHMAFQTEKKLTAQRNINNPREYSSRYASDTYIGTWEYSSVKRITNIWKVKNNQR